jgi:Bacterial CdiA-CT RNAse A domain
MQLEGLAPARSHRPAPGVEDLAVYEQHGGHTLGRHLGLSPAEALQRIHDGAAGAGCFTDRRTAQEAVDDAIHRHRDRIAEWLASGPAAARYTFSANLGRVVGTTLTRHDVARGSREPVPATAVRCVLRRSDRLPAGFTVVTAYPTKVRPHGRRHGRRQGRSR